MRIGYSRVSSDTERQKIDLQRDALIQAGVDERHIFTDYKSGVKDNREGLQKALDFLKAGDILVVWKLDRLGRSLTHLLKIMTLLQEKGVGFMSLTEKMDTTTPQGALFFHLFGALAQYERSLIQERIMAGLEAARKRGRKGGRPPVADEEKTEAILKMIEGGSSKASVARAFGIGRSTLYEILKKAQERQL